MRNLDYWIAINVTKTLRRLSEEEIAAVVAYCEEANKQPHPHLELTTPWCYEGSVPKYSTDYGDALKLLAHCTQHLDEVTQRTDFQIAITYDAGSSTPWVVTTDSVDASGDRFHADVCASGETMPLAIARFASNLYRKCK